MFRPACTMWFVHAEENLKKAQGTDAILVRQITDADAEVAARRKAFEAGEMLIRDAAQQLSNLPTDQCYPTAGVTPDGRAWRGQKCTSDPRVGTTRVRSHGAEYVLNAMRDKVVAEAVLAAERAARATMARSAPNTAGAHV